jgi:type IX secretion system PorP/SprF family membrane protein
MRYLVLILLNLTFSILYSQNEIIVNQYTHSVFAINPAISCLSEQAEADLYYKKLWGGFSDSPEFSQLTLFGPVKSKKIGVGLNLSYQQIGLFSYLTAQGSFSYKLKLNDLHFLSFCIQTGIKRLQINFSKINAKDPDELIEFPKYQANTLPTADFSVAYKYKTLLIFVGANQLLQNSFKYHDATFQPTLKSQLVPYYSMGAKWNKVISSSLNNSATIITRSHQGLPLQIDVSDMITWREKFSIGLGYRQSYSVYALGSVQLSQGLTVGYSYEYTTNQLNKYTTGGHEINICYQFNKGKIKNKEEDFQKNSANKNITALYEEIDLLNKKLDSTTKATSRFEKDLIQLKHDLAYLKSKHNANEKQPLKVDSVGKDESQPPPGLLNIGVQNTSMQFANQETDNNTTTNDRLDKQEKQINDLQNKLDIILQLNSNEAASKDENDFDNIYKKILILREDVDKLKIEYADLSKTKLLIDSLNGNNSNNFEKSNSDKIILQKSNSLSSKEKTSTKQKKISVFNKWFKKNNKKNHASPIKRNALSNVKKANEKKVVEEITNNEAKDENLFKIECLIKDSKTKKFISSEITIMEMDSKENITLKRSSIGNWQGMLKKDKIYKLICTSLGYQNVERELNSKSEQTITILMDALKKGDNFIMKSIYFHPNSYALKKESEKELQELLDYLSENPSVYIEIQGHTNGDLKIHKNKTFQGLGEEWNFKGSSKKLSANRAEVIKKQLVENGIAAERITTKGLGGSVPIVAKPETMAQGQKNIRVEIKIIKN